jgi:CDGSH-type Zn-finger protein
VPLEMKEKGQVRFCGCKHSKNAPRCDGTHKSL